MLKMGNTIIESFDLWTNAQALKTSNRGIRASNQSLLGIKKVRELILGLAVHGKLTPQNSLDEPASVLLEKLDEQKSGLIKEGKNKNQKVFREIEEDEKPYELPKGWIFVRNEILFSLRKGKMPKNLTDQKVGLPYLDIAALDRDIILQYTDDKNCPQATEEDILVVCDGSRSGLLLKGKTGIVGSTLAVIDTNSLIKPYIKVLFAQSFILYNSTMKGAAIPHLDTKNLLKSVIGFPPLAEQHRIVTKVDELMALCDQLEQLQTNTNEDHQTLVDTLFGTLTNADSPAAFEEAWQRIASHFDTLLTTEHSIDQLKQTILQIAVMGKLVAQNPDDEPASELLKKIAKEKVKLVKEGKIKKQDSLPDITHDEKLFNLPIGWQWVRLNDAIDVRDGTHDTPKEAHGENTYPLVTSKNFENGNIKFDEAKRISVEDHFEISRRSKVERYDILFSMIGGNLGNQVLVKDDRPFSIKNVALFKYYNKEYTSPFFIKKIMEHIAIDLQNKSIGGAQPFVSLGFLRSIVIALPPIAEQHRIVFKVDELFSLCDSLKERLNEAQNTQVQLAGSIVDQALN